MEEQRSETLARIHAAAMDEFAAKGFQSASLRNIVKTAGVTTGAFYGYYPSKEALFTALVGEVYDTLMHEYKTSLMQFESMSSEQQIENMGTVGGDCMKHMLRYMDTRRAQVKLLLQSAEGTKYEHMIDEFVALEVDSTNKIRRYAPPSGTERAADGRAARAHSDDRYVQRVFRDDPARYGAGRCRAVSRGTERILHRRLAENYGTVIP